MHLSSIWITYQCSPDSKSKTGYWWQRSNLSSSTLFCVYIPTVSSRSPADHSMKETNSKRAGSLEAFYTCYAQSFSLNASNKLWSSEWTSLKSSTNLLAFLSCFHALTKYIWFNNYYEHFIVLTIVLLIVSTWLILHQFTCLSSAPLHALHAYEDVHLD